MTPGRPGRIPQLVQILRDRNKPMTAAEVVKAWNLIGKNDSSYTFTTQERIGPSLAHAALNSRSTGIIRVRRGVYEFDSDALGPNPARASSIRKAAAAKAAPVKRHPAGRRLEPSTSTVVHNTATHDVKFVLDIVGEMKDGSLLLKDARSGKVWVAKEI